MKRPPGRIAGALLALLIAQPLAAQGLEVESLLFEGAKSFSRDELASAIETSATRCPNLLYSLVCWAGIGEEEAFLPTGALGTDPLRLKVYYYERGFREAQITVDTARLTDDRVRVTFHIREGQPVRVGSLEVEGLPPALAGRALPLRTGMPFDMVMYEATRDTLLNRLRNHGYARAEVLPGYLIPRADPLRAQVQFEVVPGAPARFGAIDVVGNEEATPGLVRRMLSFREGDRYDRSALLASQRNLYGLQIFRHAEVSADLKAGSDSVIPVTVQVSEGDMRRVRVGGGFNNFECGNVEASWSSRNFGGDGRRLEVHGKLGNLFMKQVCQKAPWLSGDYVADDSLTGLVSVDFTQPWLFGPRNSIGGGLFAERRSVPGVFLRSAVGVYVSVGHAVGRDGVLALSYRPERTFLRAEGGGDLFFCVNFVACAYDELSMLSEPHWLSPVTLSFSLDRTDEPFTPSSGFIVRADAEYADRFTWSDFAYTRLSGEGRTYVGKRGGVILATRLHGGVAWPHAGSTGGVGVSPEKRFFAGGANSVRGFDEYRLGPTVLGIAAVPYLLSADSTYHGPMCTLSSVNDGSCVLDHLPKGVIAVRPAGGEVLLEGSLELRFPLPALNGKLRGAAFLDAGQVWATVRDVDLRTIVATPGIGLRYYSPIGPIRIDAGFDTRGPVSLPVLTTKVEECVMSRDPGCEKITGAQEQRPVRNTADVVPLDHTVTYGVDPADPIAAFFGRFRLHFSIGQAF